MVRVFVALNAHPEGTLMLPTMTSHTDERNGAEEWRIVSSAPDYEVSSHGRVRRATAGRHKPAGALLSDKTKVRGYPTVQLHSAGGRRCVAVHILVCEAFHGPRPKDRVAAHNDGSKDNNHYTNLRWATFYENSLDMRRHNTLLFGERNPVSKLNPDAVKEIRRLFAAGERVTDIAPKFGVTTASISQVTRGATWRHV